ncbi:hypothetical protein [Teredinibacter franksiae]|jgi:hypothetical protein|uniref:hypothetical protein n=1 Tax=Teredinibacter franksiae TaxID=2761453 RepID=UPI001625FF5E|nr:hypothetical protein [Teredinibacter franksiae]
MKRQRPLLLLLLVVYIFSPTLFDWVMNPGGGWYRPYLIWLLVIVVAFIVQERQPGAD